MKIGYIAILIVLLAAVMAKAQTFSQIDSIFSSLISQVPDSAQEETSEFNQWATYISQRIDPSGSFSTMIDGQNEWSQTQKPTSCGGNWSPVTPTGNMIASKSCESQQQNAGRVNAITFKPTDANTVFIGTEGALYKRIDNTGTVSKMSGIDNLFTYGISVIATSPSNSNIVYVASGQGVSNYGWGLFAGSSSGIYKTSDGGKTFQPTGLTWGDTSKYTITSIAVAPKNASKVWVCAHQFYPDGSLSKQTVFLSNDGGKTWSQPKLPGTDQYFWSVVYSLDGKNLYLSGHHVLESTNNGTSWVNIDKMFGGKVTDTTTMSGFIILATPPKGSPAFYNKYIVALSMNSNPSASEKTDLWVSSDGFATTVTALSGLPYPYCCNSDKSGAWALHPPLLAMGVQPPTGIYLYVGGTEFGYYYDGRFTFDGYSVQTHADIRSISVPPYNGSNGGTVFIGTDGGLSKSTNGGQTVSPINGGLNCELLQGVDADASGDMLLGTQDNAEEIKSGKWNQHFIGDGGQNLFDLQNTSKYYGEDYQLSGKVYSAEVNGCAATIMSGNSLSHYSPMPMVLEPDNLRLYMGFHDLYYYDTKSEDAVQITNFQQQTGYDCGAITAIGVANDSYQTIIVATQGRWMDSQGNIVNPNYNDKQGYETCNLWKSVNRGQTWIDISPHLQSVKGTITSILCAGKLGSDVYFTMGNYYDLNEKNENVFYCNSPIGVYDVWTNLSSGLPQMPTSQIVTDANSNLYCATDAGIYYTNAALADVWKCYSAGMPEVRVTGLLVKNNTLYASTWGRGLWSSALISSPDLALSSNCKWVEELTTADGEPSYIQDYTTAGDTLIGDTDYIKLGSASYCRNDGEKVFLRQSGPEYEAMNFGLNVGDTLWDIAGATDKQDGLYCYVAGIDSVLVGSSLHKRLHIVPNTPIGFRPETYWIEGVGDEYGFFVWQNAGVGDSYSIAALTCFYENGVMQWSQPSPSGDWNCDEKISGISTVATNTIISYVRNGQIIVRNNSQQSGPLTIYNISGQLVTYAFLPIAAYDISQVLPKGVYLVNFNNKSRKVEIFQ